MTDTRDGIRAIKRKAHVNGWYQGAAQAIADMNRMHDQPTMCNEVMEAMGGYEAFRDAKVDSYDLKELRKIRKEGKGGC